ncbi:NusG domain II-containing protein [bacterium]|nr:NusG domain II-containing protein [bacterium]
MRPKTMRKAGDLVLIGVIAVFALCALARSRFFAAEGTWVSVQVDGTVLQPVPLSASDTLLIAGPLGVTRVIIDGGSVWVDEAPCPGKICKAAGKISRAGQSIVCVPNRIVITVTGKRRPGIDAITM